MKEYKAEDIRNVGIIGHGNSGKSSIAEAMLFSSNASDRLGKPGDNSSIMDSDPDEIKRKVSINTSLAHCEWNGAKINILDTPGFANFIAETKITMRVMDSVVVVLNGESGVEVETEKAWTWAVERKLAGVVFVNRMDHEQVDINRSLKMIKGQLKTEPVAVQIPIGNGPDFKGVVDLLTMKAVYFSGDAKGAVEIKEVPEELKEMAKEQREHIIEMAAESDDALTEKYLEGEGLTDQEIHDGLKAGILNNSFVPVVCGSAVHNRGVTLLMDFITRYMPSPIEVPGEKATEKKSGDEKMIGPANAETMSALVFKTIADPFAGKLSLFRVYSGSLEADGHIYNATKEVQEHVGQLFFLTGKQHTATLRVHAGDMGCTSKLKATETGHTLCFEKNALTFEKIDFPEPIIQMAVLPKSKEDDEKVSSALHRLTEEDPVLRVERNKQTGEMLISGMGVVHLEVIVERLKRKFGVEVELKTPMIPYLETIKGSTKVQGKYKKQSGGRGQYGDTWIEISPMLRGEGFVFQDKIVGGAIPKQYIPAVEKGIVETMAKGVVAGYPMIDVKVSLYDGSYHNVDSSEMAFKVAGSMGFKKGIKDCKAVLLEPIRDLKVIVPNDKMGDVIGDLNSKRGKVLGMDPTGDNSSIKAKVPMAEILRYAPDLRSLTGGRGSFTTSFSHYEEVPEHLAQKIISDRKEEKEG